MPFTKNKIRQLLKLLSIVGLSSPFVPNHQWSELKSYKANI